MLLDTHELAWAAGFFDGEGTIPYTRRWDRPIGKAILAISQCDPAPLERFVHAVGLPLSVTAIAAPSKQNVRTQYQVRVDRLEYVQHIVAVLWKYLRHTKAWAGIQVLADTPHGEAGEGLVCP